MRLWILILPLIMIASIRIDQVYYDAIDESGSEFIIIKNYGEQTESINNWVISTPSSSKDAVLSGEIKPQSTYIIADSNWDEEKDDPKWPSANHKEAITLSNNDGYVELLNEQNQQVDLVGYQNSEKYLTKPHPGVKQGESLIRISDTNNNAQDFIASKPLFETNTDKTTDIELEIINTQPIVQTISIEDDDNSKEGIQLMYYPGRNISINVSVYDKNSEGYSVLVNNINITNNQTRINNTHETTIALFENTTNITITIIDGDYKEIIQEEIEVIKGISIKIPELIRLIGLPGGTTTEEITVENTGGEVINLQIKGEQPKLAHLIAGTVTYVINNQEYELNGEYNHHEVNLKPKEKIIITLKISTNNVRAGFYTGNIIIAGVKP